MKSKVKPLVVPTDAYRPLVSEDTVSITDIIWAVRDDKARYFANIQDGICTCKVDDCHHIGQARMERARLRLLGFGNTVPDSDAMTMLAIRQGLQRVREAALV
jgi:hypothetical protein